MRAILPRFGQAFRWLHTHERQSHHEGIGPSALSGYIARDGSIAVSTAFVPSFSKLASKLSEVDIFPAEAMTFFEALYQRSG